MLESNMRGSHDLHSISQALAPANTYAALATPAMWIGVAAGAAMIYGAIRMRRWRDEG
jgi:ABC-2 type transport system permease protein